MSERFKDLRAAGEVGSKLADFLTLLTANWTLVFSLVIAIVTGGLKDLRDVALSPSVFVGAGTFLAVLWTIIGIYTLVDRRKPRMIQPFADYRYGLTFEGFTPNFVGTNSSLDSQKGAMQFGISVRNFGPGPIRYALEAADIRIGTRSIPRYQSCTVNGYMARGSGRTARPESFPAGSLAEFYGKGDTKGTADISILYGPPEGPYVRRLKLNIEMTLHFPEEGIVNPMLGIMLGFSDNIVLEKDEAVAN